MSNRFSECVFDISYGFERGNDFLWVDECCEGEFTICYPTATAAPPTAPPQECVNFECNRQPPTYDSGQPSCDLPDITQLETYDSRTILDTMFMDLEPEMRMKVFDSLELQRSMHKNATNRGIYWDLATLSLVEDISDQHGGTGCLTVNEDPFLNLYQGGGWGFRDPDGEDEFETMSVDGGCYGVFQICTRWVAPQDNI